MAEREDTITELCREAVQRLAAALAGTEVGCLLLDGDSLRHAAHSGRLPLIFEITREQGGVVWRAADNGVIQLVEDVRSDPDYLTSHESVRSEIAAPIAVDGRVVGVLDVEFPERVFDRDAVDAVEGEAARLAAGLSPYVS